MRNWNVLTDLDFEALACDLFSAELKTSVERFASGADGGIDLRWVTTAGGFGVAQCKHYLRSTFAQLLAAAKKEVPKVSALQPAEYKFITSFDLGVSQKKQIYDLFASWMNGPQDVYGSNDIDGLLTGNLEIERKHVKLWLSTGSQLFWSTHSDLVNRSEALRERVQQTLPNYVASGAFEEASAILEHHKICLIAGEPGIGKTVLARMLLAEALGRGFEPLEVSGDINEAWAALDSDRLQVFLYDDFLGQISFSERLGKNEDRRLADFISKISKMKSKRLIMTTREYILKDAHKDYRLLRELGESLHFLLELRDYSRGDKALILYNHLWRAAVHPRCLRELENEGWARIIDHPHYSPRLIEYCTGGGFDMENPGYISRFVGTLDHPEEVWSNAFDRHLNGEQQALLVVLVSLPVQVEVDDLYEAHRSYCATIGKAATRRAFFDALEMLEHTFIDIAVREGKTMVRFHSPSVAEFVLSRLSEDLYMLMSLIDSAVFFEQLLNLQRIRSGGSVLGKRSQSGRSRALPIDSLQEQFISALERTFMSKSPDRLLNQGTFITGYEPPYGLSETRLSYLWQQSKSWRPSDAWMENHLLMLAERWSGGNGGNGGNGGKKDAVKLLRLVGLGSISVAMLASVRNALEHWLSHELEETDDWMIYLDYLDQEDRHAHQDAVLANKFEQHALDELDRWSPSPPLLDKLITHAQSFGLTELEEQLDEKSREDEAREEKAEDRLASIPRPDPQIARPEDHNEFIGAIFTRLARTKSV
ncbi:hypothetical protein [Streptosporangium subroseum]|uniref:nSTAND3 domain-containing NTPase n=1 Tax=Streptosporangium subroseum TaxID=106412 RepID=UPI0030921FEF|nr:ATP-binding protein [Streptosporangium subroseum]